MAEIINMEKVYMEILALRREVQLIKNHMVDIDTIMTTEEEEKFERAMKDYKDGKTISLEDLKKELEL